MGPEPIKLLLIEDNPGDARLIQVLLSSVRGGFCSVITAPNLKEGFQCLDSESFDIVLLDLNLPDSMGVATFEQLLHHCKSANLSQVPIILLTGLEDEELALDTVRRGAQDYLVKGALDADLLSRAIRYAIERKHVEEALRESEERYSMAMRGANDGLWDWKLHFNKIYYSPRWKSILGYEEDEIGDSPAEWFNRIHPDDVERVRVSIGTHLKEASPHFECEYRIRNKAGNYLWVLTRGLAVHDADGHAYRMAGSQSDITARKQAEEQLLRNAFYDNLTGLPNRALFMDRLSQAIEHTKRRPDYPFSVLFLDLDRFKVINDSLGHMVGDQLLIAVAQVLKTCLRSGDTVARLGGDEFIILLQDSKQDSDAIAVSNRICQELGVAFNLSKHQVVISTSIGIVYSSLGYDNPEDIMRDADIAMYKAKMSGGATYSIFNTLMREQAINRLELENDLRKALENHEFSIYYQPIQSLDDEQLIGFEALLRWNHPKRGMIMPASFISVAEETGLILPIGRWVMREACLQLRQWQTEFSLDPPLMVSVNVSSKQLLNADFLQNTSEILHETGIAPFSMALEITETLLLESNEALNIKLNNLVKLGVHLNIDDFGTGYSSYSYLQRLPLTAIKIDSIFIHKLENDADNSEIVRSIIMLARSLGMSAIAEGVETEAQLAKLKSLDCQYGQGFYIAVPLNLDQAKTLLVSRFGLSS